MSKPPKTPALIIDPKAKQEEPWKEYWDEANALFHRADLYDVANDEVQQAWARWHEADVRRTVKIVAAALRFKNTELKQAAERERSLRERIKKLEAEIERLQPEEEAP